MAAGLTLCFERRHSVADVADRFSALETEYDHFSNWNKRGTWEKCLDRLTAYRRLKAGNAALPSYGIIDAQSVKT